ncbi:MAG: hypothetical protein NC912_01110 [Candidatus Omnitrophica bacterium]|nr:hypothetical protein [Candidatus Omnitrophota bacterium]
MGMWQEILIEPSKMILTQIGHFFVKVLLVVIILFIGWVISKFIKTLVIKVLKSVKFVDYISAQLKLDEILVKGGIRYSLTELIGVICYWLVLLVTFVVVVNAIGLTIAADLLNKIVLYIPNVIAAIFILILGIFVGALLKNIVQTAAINAGLSQARLLSRLVEIVVIIFASIIAMEQLNIGTKTIELIIAILLGAIGFALALAFGLGCKDMAAKFLNDLIESIKSRK